MTQGREHFALDWLKDELDETLKAARQALESYAESERDETKLRSCLTALHQVHGTLLMLELTGVTVLSDELEQLAQAMYGGIVDDMESAQQLLMQGILQLPAHLEEIQKGRPDSRRAVLVLANDIRLARGDDAFPDAAGLAQTDVLAAADDEVLSRFDQIDGVAKARKIRGAYQQVLLSVLKGKSRGDAPAVLSKVAVGLERICEGTPMAVLWQAFGSYVGAVADAGVELSGEIVKLLRRVDAEIKALATHGREALERPINKELLGTLIDGASAFGAEDADLKQIADALAKDASEQGAAVSGREAIQHAASALREELAAIKDDLDLFVRSENRTMEGLKRLGDPLKQIGSTLTILGFESSRAVVADQVGALTAAQETESIDESVLMGIAGALIQVDENLAALAHTRHSPLVGTSEASAIIGDAHVAVLAEARNGLEETKHAVVDYITAQWDASLLEAVPDLLDAVKGALAMVPLTEPAKLLGHCAEYVRTRLLGGDKPDWADLDHFADAISGVDYYLERLSAEGASPGDEILNLVRRSLTALGMNVAGDLDAESEPVLMETVAEQAKTVAEQAKPVAQQAKPDAAAPDQSNVVELGRDLPEPEKPAESAPETIPEADDSGAANEFDLELVEDDAPARLPEIEDEADDEVTEAPIEAVELTAVPDDEERSPVVDAGPIELEPVDSGADDAEVTVDPPPIEFVNAEAAQDAASEPTVPDSTVAEEVPPSATPEPAEPAASREVPEPTLDEDFDEEIVEIFAEEVEEVLESVDEWLPRWADDFGNEEALTETRRAFHTLKGSGRIVGAQLIGELAWSIENMLNRIMDATIEPHGQVATLVREARHLIPSLSESFRARQPVEGESIAAIMGRADVLASGGRIEELGAPVEIPSTDVEPGVSEEVEIDASADVPEPPTRVEQADEREETPMEPAPESVRVEEVEQDSAANDDERDLDDMIAALRRDEPPAVAGVPESAPEQAAAESAEVMALFEEEANRHLEILESRFNSEDDAGELELDESVMRALHTLRGSSAMAGIESVAGIADPLYQVATAFTDANQSVTSDLFDFLQQGVFALRRSVDAIRSGDVPDEDEALFQAEARRILSEMASSEAPGVASLLQLEGTTVLLGAGETMRDWRDGNATVEALAEVLAALHEVRNESQSRNMDGVADLCDGLIASYQRFEGVSLPPVAFDAMDHAHELLLDIFDRIAAEQALPGVAEAVAGLAGLDGIHPVDVPVDALAEADGAEVIDFPGEGVAETGSSNDVEFDGLAADAAGQPGSRADNDAESATIRVARLPADVDQEILEIFFEEADELLESIDQSTHDWLDQRDNRVHLENLLRALHTLKGGARLAGLMELGDETHALESYVIAVQNDEADPDEEFFNTLQRRHDELASSVALLKAAARGEQVDPEGVPMGRDSEAAVAEPADDVEELIEPVIQDVEPAPAPAQEPADVSAAVVPLQPEPETEAPAASRGTKEPREMVRVAANLLEELVNLAGENSIIRSRIEQGINDFSISLEEMETTIERVREQLRRLEIETEAQVLFRHDRRDGPNYEDFDPLEMDRYSQLQQVSRSLSETASDMLDLKETLAAKARESETLLIQQARINTELQEGLMRTRMVPFSRLLPRLRRIVRQVARDLGKQVEFHAYNAEGELDRHVLERMVPPLEHMLRNSADHGIEAPEIRASYGKPEVGRIDLRLSRDAGDVVIEITDDGAGIDVETVRAKAIERGLMSADAWMADDDILQFVLAPGFSTAESVTQISGRGVGMDVVHSAVKQLGGSINITSTPGQGSRFTVRLPFTVSVNRALMVSVADDMYAVPLNNIEGIVRVATRELDDLMAPDGMGFEYAGVPYRVTYLGAYLGRGYKSRPDQTSVPMVLMRSGDHALAVFVDGVQGSREIVVKSLGPQFAGVGGISGATILGDGSVVVILDLITLIRAQTAGAVQKQKQPEPPKAASSLHRPVCVMVVDDSVTVRKVTSRLLERQGMDVLVAKDGVEAVAMLQERRPDIILLDIEMPRMDGFEVARQVRHDEALKDLPIVMISSRTGTKHQERAVELGVNRFLGKPFQENELLSTIDELVESGE